MGFDDLDVARVLDPPLTTVTADAGELGRVAFELLSEQMAGRYRPPGPTPGSARRARLDRTRLTPSVSGKPRHARLSRQ